MKINAVIHRKENDLYPTTCVVEKTVALTDAQFQHFSANLLRDHNFIAYNVDVMYQDRDGTRHCLLVIGETNPDGILVDSQGSNYARYAAHVPNIRELALLERLPSELRALLEKVAAITDWIADTMVAQQGRIDLSLEDIEKEFDVDLRSSMGAQEILGHVLIGHKDVFDVEFADDALTVMLKTQEMEML